MPEALERVGGLQAQEPKPPFTALWSRIEGFAREDLLAALHDRTAVRATLMRATLHTMSAGDVAALRPALQPMLTQALRVLGERAEGLDSAGALKAARTALKDGPRTAAELRDALGEAFPDADLRALGYAVRTQLPLVMVPTEDRWGFPASARFTLAEEWLGRPLKDPGPEAVVLRHLAAFGPATAADVQTWSGLGGLKPVLEGLRPKLATFRDEARPRAVRPAGRAASRRGRPRAGALPARVRQPDAGARRPHARGRRGTSQGPRDQEPARARRIPLGRLRGRHLDRGPRQEGRRRSPPCPSRGCRRAPRPPCARRARRCWAFSSRRPPRAR